VDSSYQPSFSVYSSGNSTLSVHRGESSSLRLDLRGNSSSPLSIKFSDSLFDLDRREHHDECRQ
jgi:hypothetical protein